MAQLLAAPSPRVAINAYAGIATAWNLSMPENEKLLGVSERTAYRWLKEGQREAARPDVIERISHLLHIYQDLIALFGRGELAKTWVRRPNQAFGDRPPLDRMLRGGIADLVFVRSYLDLARYGSW